jgi:hypothetical protein
MNFRMSEFQNEEMNFRINFRMNEFQNERIPPATNSEEKLFVSARKRY